MMTKTILLSLPVLAMTAGIGFAENDKADSKPAVPATTVSAPAPKADHAGKPAAHGGGAEVKSSLPELVTVSGKVVEMHDTPSYTYFLVDKEGKQTWVAVPPTKGNVGDELTFQPGTRMGKFSSPSLKKTFDDIVFSIGIAGADTAGKDDFLMKKLHGGATPADAAAGAAVPAEPLSGKVVEVTEGGGYSFFLIEKDGKKIWVATPPTSGKVGDVVSFKPGMEMKNFTSKSLNKTFESIVFSEGSVMTPEEGEAMKSMAHKQVMKEAAKPMDKEGKPVEVKVEKATAANAYTVAELYAKSAELNGKEVVVKGKVVKVSRQIMGRNWIHIQDGSGVADTGTNNLVTTSQEAVQKGDVVTAKGILAKDKDFGGGYQYAVIVEETTYAK